MASARRRVLVVDDDGHIREVLRYALDAAGYEVVEAAAGDDAWTIFQRHGADGDFDLVVLDIVMPGLDGLEVCRLIRSVSRVPILFLSSKDEELDRVLGLELGADDYVTKPFSPRELLARVKAALRRYDEIRALSRASHDPPSTDVLGSGEIELDRLRHECRVGAEPLVLTVTEFGLLEALLEAPGRVLSRAQLVQRVYGAEYHLSDRTVDSHIRRLRKKLRQAGSERIETVYGVGFRLQEPE